MGWRAVRGVLVMAILAVGLVACGTRIYLGPTSTPTATFTPTPIATPTATSAPTPNGIATTIERTEATVTALPTLTPAPTPTLDSLPTTTPTPTPEPRPVSDEINSLAWVKDGMAGIEEFGVERLESLARWSRGGFWELMMKPWIRDNLTRIEREVVSGLRIIALYDAGTRTDEWIIQILRMPFLDSVEVNDTLAMQALRGLGVRNQGLLHQALAGLLSGSGITDDQAEFVPLLLMEQYDSNAADAIRTLPWAMDGMADANEVNMAVDLQVLAAESPKVFWELVGKTWMQGIKKLSEEDRGVVRNFGYIATGPDRDGSSALQVAQMRFLESLEPDDYRVMQVLYQIHDQGPESLAQFLSDPRLIGGITDDSAAIVLQMGGGP